jgi:hypothetical protein
MMVLSRSIFSWTRAKEGDALFEEDGENGDLKGNGGEDKRCETGNHNHRHHRSPQEKEWRPNDGAQGGKDDVLELGHLRSLPKF